MGGNLTSAIVLSKDLKKDNRIEDAGKQGVDSETEAECRPDVPMEFGGVEARTACGSVSEGVASPL
jgi:hypothetical protein